MNIRNIIDYALRNGKIDNDRLVEMVNQMDEEMALRFTEAILGMVDPMEIPEVSNVYGHSDCFLRSYNYLMDKVTYEYDNLVVRYFKTQEEAEQFKEGKLYRWDGERVSSDEYSFEGKHVFTDKETCRLSDWLDGAK